MTPGRTTLDMSADAIAAARAGLIQLITARSLLTGSEIQLASGRTSAFYFNMKATMMHPDGAAAMALLILDRLRAARVTHIGGLEMGAVPIASATAALSAMTQKPLQAFFVRKEVKEHGTRKLIEGLADGETLAGCEVCLLEDVTTTGGSALKAADVLRAGGAVIDRVITVVDRGEGAGEAFAAQGLAFEPLLTRADFNAAGD